jgi:hypothetical protein
MVKYWKGRIISFEDIRYYQKILVAQAENYRIMQESDRFEII